MHINSVPDYCTLSKILLYYVPMDLATVKDELREYLNSDGVSLAEIERSTTLNRSWLSKFRRGEIVSPTIDQLVELDTYRQSVGTV